MGELRHGCFFSRSQPLTEIALYTYDLAVAVLFPCRCAVTLRSVPCVAIS